MARRDPKKALAARPPSADYEVGYGKPPAHARFKPGRSGNPSGRPKGSRKKPTVPSLNEERLKSIILEEAYRTININDANGQASISIAQAIVRSLAVNAAKGNQRAQHLFTELLTSTERDNKRLHDEWLETAIEYKVEWDKELERRKQLGIDAPAPIPHPDHVIIDMQTGDVRITGPMTKEDKIHWDMFLAAQPLSRQQFALPLLELCPCASIFDSPSSLILQSSEPPFAMSDFPRAQDQHFRVHLSAAEFDRIPPSVRPRQRIPCDLGAEWVLTATLSFP